MKNSKRIAALVMSFLAAAAFAGCTAVRDGESNAEDIKITENLPDLRPTEETPEGTSIETPEEETPAGETFTNETPPVQVPEKNTVTYLSVTGNSINMRSGAGTDYTAYGAVDKSTMYAYDGQTNGWIKTRFKNKTAYISAKYCELVEMTASGDSRIEAVISEGTKLLGAPYVYGATRYHNGNGKLLSGFNSNEYDCSSLMQYIFYKGAEVNLQLNTRTQIYQGKTVKKSDIKRGDLLFFTNASRKNNVGIERVGHVALYLGDNLILHTASDYAKIEQISATRWGYFIQAQRIL